MDLHYHLFITHIILLSVHQSYSFVNNGIIERNLE